MKVSVIIVSFNKLNPVLKAINSVKNSKLDGEVEVFLIDNSTDLKIKAKLEKIVKKLKVNFFANSENVGFAKAVNQGIKEAIKKQADFVFLLNDDAWIDEMCLNHLISVLKKDSYIALAGPTIFYAKEPEKIWSSGGIFNKFLASIRIPFKNKVIDKNKLKVMEPREVDFLTGCALLIRVECIQKLGLFDESLFFYAEDLEYSLRVKKVGYKLVWVPYAFCWHDIDITQGRTSPFVMHHLARSNVIVRKKHFSKPYYFYYLFLHFLLFTPFRMFQVLRGSRDLKAIFSWLKGTWEGIKF